jgi:hypothetical protein
MAVRAAAVPSSTLGGGGTTSQGNDGGDGFVAGLLTDTAAVVEPVVTSEGGNAATGTPALAAAVFDITGVSVAYAGGGGGFEDRNFGGAGRAGRLCGRRRKSLWSGSAGVDGTGGGGGAALPQQRNDWRRNGGDGVCIIRYRL